MLNSNTRQVKLSDLNPFNWSQKSDRATQENNELYFALYSLLRVGQIDFYNRNPREYIEKGYVVNPNLYSVINSITKPASTVPWALFEVKDEEKLRKYKSLMETGQYAEANVFRAKALHLSENTTRQEFFKKPNETQRWSEWIEGSLGFKLLTGNNFIYGLSPVGFEDIGLFTKIYNMPSQFVEIVVGEWQDPIRAYRLLTNINIQFDAHTVLHRKYWNPEFDTNGGFAGSSFSTFGTTGAGASNFYGLSPMAPLCKVVQRSNDGYIASMRMLVNGIPAGILSPDTGGKPLTSTEKKKLDEAWKERFGGARNKNEVIKASVPLKWQALGLNSVDMQLEESQDNDLASMARVYNVPLPIVDGSKGGLFDSGEKNKVANKVLWTDAIIPEFDDLRGGLNDFLVPGWEKLDNKRYFIDYDLSGIGALQGNLKEISQRVEKELRVGMWSPNEARLMLGGDMDEDNPEMNEKFIATNLRQLTNNKDANAE